MRFSLFAIFLIPLSLAGCFAGGASRNEMAYYYLPDEVQSESVSSKASGLSSSLGIIPRVEVHAPVWLNTPAMQYRLLYTAAEQRLSFVESRWVAPPAEMLELALKRRISFNEGRSVVDGCKLRVDLDEFIQVFDMPGSSRATVEVRATLFSSQDGKIMAQRRFLQTPTAGVDARSGVAAFVVAVRSLGADIDAWLIRLAQDSPLTAEHCRVTGFN